MFATKLDWADKRWSHVRLRESAELKEKRRRELIRPAAVQWGQSP